MDQEVALGQPRNVDRQGSSPPQVRPGRDIYAALDLGTNNCRLLIARPAPSGFHIVDSFSRIVRLGEALSLTGQLLPGAVERTIAALHVCRDKIAARGVTRSRLIATEACRAADNAADFIAEVLRRTGLPLEIIDRETEARLAAEGCAILADPRADSVILFDIGGGSSEIVWLDRPRRSDGETGRPRAVAERIRAWTSLPLGVVSLADQFGGRDVSAETFAAMTDHVVRELAPFAAGIPAGERGGVFHLLGTSGTVTTIAAVHLGLPRYDRRRVDGLWMSDAEVVHAIARLRAMPFEMRAAHGCIGTDRADLVLPGCAILEALRRTFPSPRLRIADRGLREGILMEMMNRDGVWPEPRRPGPT